MPCWLDLNSGTVNIYYGYTTARAGAAQTAPVNIKRKTSCTVTGINLPVAPFVGQTKKEELKKDLRSKESRDHYREDGLVPSLR